MHEHCRLGVPVRLRADVDSGHHDVDLMAALRELDDPPEYRGDPVHALGAGVHGDLRSGREGEPVDGDLFALGLVERGDDPPALGLRERAERQRRVTQQGHPSHPFGITGVGVGYDADHDAGSIRRRRAVYGHQIPVLVEVVLGEISRLGRVRSLTISAGWTVPRRRAATIRRAPSSRGSTGRWG